MTKLAERLVAAGEGCAQNISGALDKARTAVADAGHTILYSAPAERARAGARAVDAFAHKSPWALAGGIGLIAVAVGWLLRRR